MKPERWKQVEQLYHAALEREPGARGTFIDQACAGDEELRREVEELLRFDGAAAVMGTGRCGVPGGISHTQSDVTGACRF
jgi:hypothetical protein